VEEDFYSRYYEIEDRHWWFAGRREIFLRLLDRQLGSGNGDRRVLDVGCGTGTLAVRAARAAPGVEVTGLDADPAILVRARERATGAGLEIDFDQALSTALPYADASFDLVVSTLFFHHLRDDDKRGTAKEILRVLRPGGRLVVGDLGRPHDPLMRVVVRTTVQVLDGVTTTSLNVRGELPAVLSAAGFQDVAVHRRMRAPVSSLDVIAGRRAL
jgi:ubiquinone/menaquinone biosynthesis C-methylase UbiE